MPASTFSGMFGGYLANLRILLADTTAWRTWTGTSTQANALARIVRVTKAEGSITYPVAMIFPVAPFRAEAVAMGNGCEYVVPVATMRVRFMAAVSETDPETAAEDFCQHVFDCIEGILTLSGTAYDSTKSYLIVQSAEVAGGDDGRLIFDDLDPSAKRMMWEWTIQCRS